MTDARRSQSRTRNKRQSPTVRVRSFLTQLRSQGLLADHPDVEDVLDAVVLSGEDDAMMDTWTWLQAQNDLSAQPETVAATETLFHEPGKSQLNGQILIGTTLPSGHDVHIPLTCFGNSGQIGIYGGIGSGKSTLLNFITVQLIQCGVPVTIYDPLDQCAKPLVSTIPDEQLGVVRFRDYQRNPCKGPRGIDQLTWLESVGAHLREALELEGPTFDTLIELAEEVVDQQSVLSFRGIINVLQRRRARSTTESTLLRRLRALRSKAPGLLKDEGFDLDRFFSRSMIFELKQASQRTRRLLYGDHFHWLQHGEPTLDKWKLRRVLVFHEASVLLSRGGDEDSIFKNVIRLGRNFGIGLVMADQTPQKQDSFARSNIGLKCFLRQDDEEGIVKYRKLMGGLSDEQMHYVLNLPNRHMIVKVPGIKFPFEVKIPELT